MKYIWQMNIYLKIFYWKLEKIFDVRKIEPTENPKPLKKAMFSFYIENQWFELSLKKEFHIDHPVKGLDVEMLSDLVIDPIFGKFTIFF